MRLLIALLLLSTACAPDTTARNVPPCDPAAHVTCPRQGTPTAFAQLERLERPDVLAASFVPVFADAAIAPAPASSTPAPEPTPLDLANAVAAKAWPLATAVGIFLLAKLITAMGWVTGKGGKLVLVFLLTAGSAAVNAMVLGNDWMIAVLGSVTAGLAAIGIFSGGKNTLQAAGAIS